MSDSTQQGFGAASRSMIVLAAFVIVIAGLRAAAPILVPFLLAVFIATIAEAPVAWLKHRKVPGALAIALVMLAMVVLLIAIGALIAQSVNGFGSQLPFYKERLTSITADLLTWLTPYAESFGVELSTDALLSYFDPAVALDIVGNALSSLGGVLSNGFLILLTIIFILSEVASFPGKLRRAIQEPAPGFDRFASFGDTVNRYVAIKTTISAITGILAASGLALLGVDFPLLWGLLTFMLNFVPTIGSIIAAVPPVLLALVQLGPFAAVLVMIGYLVLNIVMGTIVETRFMGRGLGLSTLVVFLSLVFWGWVLGPMGMLLSIPLTMTAKMALEASPSSRWLAQLLGPARAPEQATSNEPASA